MSTDPERFLTRLGTVTEVSMRIALWREYFTHQHPDDALRLVQHILAAQRVHHPHASPALLALARLIQEDADIVQKALLSAAIVAQDDEVVQLLSQWKPVRVAHRTQLRPPALKHDREITLGERRSWARSRDRDVLTRLLMDPDPVVIRNLLKNPRLLERDVLRIASAQPVAAEVLSEIFRSDHWCGRPSVQLALLQNPYTPPDLARSLLELLDSVGLKSLVDATQIHPALRRAARIRLAEQAGPRTVPGNPYDDAWVAELLESRVEDGQGDNDT